MDGGDDSGCDEQHRRRDGSDGDSAEQTICTGADQRTDQLQTLLDGGQQPVAAGELIVVEQIAHEAPTWPRW